MRRLGSGRRRVAHATRSRCPRPYGACARGGPASDKSVFSLHGWKAPMSVRARGARGDGREFLAGATAVSASAGARRP